MWCKTKIRDNTHVVWYYKGWSPLIIFTNLKMKEKRLADFICYVNYPDYIYISTDLAIVNHNFTFCTLTSLSSAVTVNLRSPCAHFMIGVKGLSSASSIMAIFSQNLQEKRQFKWWMIQLTVNDCDCDYEIKMQLMLTFAFVIWKIIRELIHRSKTVFFFCLSDGHRNYFPNIFIFICEDNFLH